MVHALIPLSMELNIHSTDMINANLASIAMMSIVLETEVRLSMKHATLQICSSVGMTMNMKFRFSYGIR